MPKLIILKNDIPTLRDPVLVSAFAVRRRGGRLAANSLEYLVKKWNADPIARLDSEDFLDFTVRRPLVRRPGDRIVIEWPDTRIYLARPEGSERDILLLTGYEPNFYWRAFSEAIGTFADSVGVKTLVSIRSFPGSVPHTRPAPILITASDVQLEVQFGVQSRSFKYEGPTDVSGVLAAYVQTLRWETADLSLVQPYYFPRMPNAAASVALLRVLDRAFGTETDVAELENEAAEQANTIEESISGDAETKAMISELEHRYDQGLERMDFLGGEPEEPMNLPSGEEVVEEIERFLRGGDNREA